MFAEAGIKSVTLNEVVAFTPAAHTLKAIEEATRTQPNATWSTFPISDRLYFIEGTGWLPLPGLPSRGQAKVLAKFRDDMALRLLEDATASLTRTRRNVEPDALVASPTTDLRSVAKFIREALDELVGTENGATGKRRQLLMDDEESIHLPLEKQPPYPVTEVEVADEDQLKGLVSGEDGAATSHLHELLLYLVARNYRSTDSNDVDLQSICKEVLPDVLDDGLLLRRSNTESKWQLRNLSQGSRAFIAFGRRGTVIVHASTVDSKAIRSSVLTMIETLRSRFQNLLVASSIMDSLLLRLARLMEDDKPQTSRQEADDLTDLLKRLGTATYIYGLAVTDPGAQLLDGSVVSIIADRAENYFEIQSLRHACQRKMEAIRTIWTSYQDRRRQTLLQAMRPPTPYVERI